MAGSITLSLCARSASEEHDVLPVKIHAQSYGKLYVWKINLVLLMVCIYFVDTTLETKTETKNKNVYIISGNI